jgi:hypothetical protein
MLNESIKSLSIVPKEKVHHSCDQGIRSPSQRYWTQFTDVPVAIIKSVSTQTFQGDQRYR